MSYIWLQPTERYVTAVATARLELDKTTAEIGRLHDEIEAGGDPAAISLARESIKGAYKRAGTQTQAVNALELAMDHASARDAMQAERPDGCWCLGLGGRGERYVPDGDGGGTPVLDEICEGCPEGAAAMRERDTLMAAWQGRIRGARLERYFGSAKVPPRYRDATLDSYPVTPSTAHVVAQLREYVADCRTREGRSVLMHGDYGTGKTGLAIGAMRAAIEEHAIDALFVTLVDLLNEIRTGYGPRGDGDGKGADELQRLVRETGLLVLDDLGADRPTEWSCEVLFGLINYRYSHNLRTIFTSNYEPGELAEHWKPQGERIVWRIVEMSDSIAVDGPNLRVPGVQRRTA